MDFHFILKALHNHIAGEFEKIGLDFVMIDHPDNWGCRECTGGESNLCV